MPRTRGVRLQYSARFKTSPNRDESSQRMTCCESRDQEAHAFAVWDVTAGRRRKCGCRVIQVSGTCGCHIRRPYVRRFPARRIRIARRVIEFPEVSSTLHSQRPWRRLKARTAIYIIVKDSVLASLAQVSKGSRSHLLFFAR